MTKSLYTITTTNPKCIDHNNGSILINDLSSGLLSFSWPNISSNANILDNGKYISNLSCGTYTLNIYNISTKQKSTVPIELVCSDLLKIDLIAIQGDACTNSVSPMIIEWSGGMAPYSLVINNHKINNNVQDNKYIYNIHSNLEYNVCVYDKNKCSVCRSNIKYIANPLNISVYWDPILNYGSSSSLVECKVNGGSEPYKIAWFINNENKPIITNHFKLHNKLQANTYKVIVTDNNNCEISKTFTINNPQPLSVTTRILNDYSSMALYDPVEVTRIHNLLLIPKIKTNLISINETQSITIKQGGSEYTQKVCMDYGETIIDGISYYYYYITPGLNINKLSKLKLIINDVSYDIDNFYSKNKNIKLLIGSLILQNDFSFNFKNQDLVEISCTEDQVMTQLSSVYVRSGMYISNNLYTILNLIHAGTTDVSPINIVNRDQQDKIYIQSLTTKKNNRLGSITCYVSNGDQASLKAILSNQNNDILEIPFNNKNYINIENLTYGNYSLVIKDKFNTASIYNNKHIENTKFIFEILSSFENEREISALHSAQIFGINSSYLNRYDNLPNKLLFTSTDFKNGVLINISPMDACYNIIGDNIDIQDCGVKVLDLPYGKYSITLFKIGYKTTKIDFLYNSPKDLVTTILEKDM